MILIFKAGFQNTMVDKKNIVMFLVLFFIVDNGVNRMIYNAIQVGEPVGVFEGFIMCVNHWYYLIIFFVGFIFMLSGVPKLDHNQIFMIYRSGKLNWLFGEILQIAANAGIYVMLLLAGCVLGVSRYSYFGNIWSNFTVYYKLNYEGILSDSNRFIDQQVYKYYTPYQSLVHCIILLWLCLVLMGSIVLLFAVMNKKIIGIILNMVLVLFVLIFNEYHAPVMWLSPFCHSVLALHNTFVYKQLSVPLWYSYLFLLGLELIVVLISTKQLKKKMFY